MYDLRSKSPKTKILLEVNYLINHVLIKHSQELLLCANIKFNKQSFPNNPRRDACMYLVLFIFVHPNETVVIPQRQGRRSAHTS